MNEAKIITSHEEFKEKYPSFQYQILGTDISTKAISTAVEGVYKERYIAYGF